MSVGPPVSDQPPEPPVPGSFGRGSSVGSSSVGSGEVSLSVGVLEVLLGVFGSLSSPLPSMAKKMPAPTARTAKKAISAYFRPLPPPRPPS